MVWILVTYDFVIFKKGKLYYLYCYNIDKLLFKNQSVEIERRDILIAEIKGKISSSGSNLSDRLEDKLTGDVFGALRYLKFNRGLRQLIENTKFYYKNGQTPIEEINILGEIGDSYWHKNIKFWPYDEEGEIDLLLEFEKAVIGIEVKYLSGLSSDDDIDNSANDDKKKSSNQLSRESNIIGKIIKNNHKKGFLIFLAPEDVCESICEEVIKRDILEEDVILGALTWQKVHDVIEDLINISDLEHIEKVVLSDIQALLKRKGFERFRNFHYNGCNEIKIEEDKYFDFKINDVNYFDFDIDINVKGDLAYEF